MTSGCSGTGLRDASVLVSPSTLRQIECVTFACMSSKSMSRQRRAINELVMRGELFHVNRSEGRSFVDVDPELHDCLFRILAFGEFDHRYYNLLLVYAAADFLYVIAEYPCVGLAFVLQDAQGTLLVALRLHADFLLCMRTDGRRGVYTVDSRGQQSSGQAAFVPLLLAVSHADNSCNSICAAGFCLTGASIKGNAYMSITINNQEGFSQLCRQVWVRRFGLLIQKRRKKCCHSLEVAARMAGMGTSAWLGR